MKGDAGNGREQPWRQGIYMNGRVTGNVRERPAWKGNDMALHAAADSRLRCFPGASPAFPGPREDRPRAFRGVMGKNFIKKPEIGVFHGGESFETFINKKKLMIS